MVAEKTINEIVSYLNKDRGVKKHVIGEVKVWQPSAGQPFPEIRAYWDTNNFGTVKPVITRLMEVYGDILSTAGFYKSDISPYLSVPINNMVK